MVDRWKNARNNFGHIIISEVHLSNDTNCMGGTFGSPQIFWHLALPFAKIGIKFNPKRRQNLEKRGRVKKIRVKNMNSWISHQFCLAVRGSTIGVFSSWARLMLRSSTSSEARC